MDRPQTPAILQANLLILGVIIIGLLIAILFGAILGQSEFVPILLIAAVLGAVIFAVGLYRYVWQMALFFLFFAFSYRPTSFSFGALEVSSALGVGLITIFIWQKRGAELPPLFRAPFTIFLQRTLFVWLLYLALHLVFNVTSPYRPGEFALGNAVKSYFSVAAPLLLLFYFIRSPASVIVGKDFFWTIARLCLIGLFINLGVRFYELATGGTVYIPGIKASENIYALRTIGPLSMMLGAVGITAGGERKTFIRYVIYWLLLLIGATGSALSAGRVTLLIGFASVCGVLVMRRKVVALFLVMVIGILGAALANLCADWINTEANPYLERSLQWMLLHKKGESIRTIESSTDWREDLFRRAIAEWRSNPRVFWTGRATYGFGVADETAILISGGYEALIETALRRGATHNLISDLLVTYGIVGLILYLAVYVAIIRFLWSLLSRRDLSPPAANLVLACFVGSLSWFVYSVAAGNFYPTEYVWFIIILVGAFYSGTAFQQHKEGVRRVSRPYLERMPQKRLRRSDATA